MSGGGAKWVLYKDDAGEFRFRLVAANGQIIAVGEGYGTKADARQGIETVRAYASANLPVYDRTDEDLNKTRIAGAL